MNELQSSLKQNLLKQSSSSTVDEEELDLCKKIDTTSGSYESSGKCNGVFSEILAFLNDPIDAINRGIQDSFSKISETAAKAREFLNDLVKALTPNVEVYGKVKELLLDAIDNPNMVRINCIQIVSLLKPRKSAIREAIEKMENEAASSGFQDPFQLVPVLKDELLAVRKISFTCNKLATEFSFKDAVKKIEAALLNESTSSVLYCLQIVYRFVERREEKMKGVISATAKSSFDMSTFEDKVDDIEQKSTGLKEDMMIENVTDIPISVDAENQCKKVSAIKDKIDRVKDGGEERISKKIEEVLGI